VAQQVPVVLLAIQVVLVIQVILEVML